MKRWMGLAAAVMTMILGSQAHAVKLSKIMKLTPEQIAAQIQIERSPYEKHVKIRAPGIGDGIMAEVNVFIRAFVTEKTIYQAYVTFYYHGDWRFYNRAAFLGGAPAQLVEIDRSVSTCRSYFGCSYFESVGVDLDREQLIVARESGISFAVFSKSGHQTPVFIPGNYIQAILNVVDRVVATPTPKVSP